MGYTHYFTADKKVTGYENAVPTIKKILKKYKKIIRHECDEKGPAVCDEDHIFFNGIGDDGHETFVFDKNRIGFSFCKTARKPYDVVVCEVLLVLDWHCPELNVSSDGFSGYHYEGLENGGIVENEHVDGSWGEAIKNVQKYGVKFNAVCTDDNGSYFQWDLKKESEEKFVGDLDDIVHDIASELASNANNNGYQGQIEFLKVVAGLTDDDIAERLRNQS